MDKFPIIHAALVQGTPEWHKLRLGKFTASEFGRLTTTRNKPDVLPAGALTYCLEVITERITGKPAKDDFKNAAMEHGTRWEPIARQTYEKIYDLQVQQVGFIQSSEFVGYSADGLVDPNGSVEIKCPATIIPHAEFLRMKSLKDESSKYHWQVIGGLYCSGREWIDFVSYSPFFPAEMQFKKYRIYAEDVQDDLKFLDLRLNLAEAECQTILAELQEPSTGLLTT